LTIFTRATLRLAQGLSVGLSVTSRCSIETAKQIDLDCGTEATLRLLLARLSV